MHQPHALMEDNEINESLNQEKWLKVTFTVSADLNTTLPFWLMTSYKAECDMGWGWDFYNG